MLQGLILLLGGILLSLIAAQFWFSRAGDLPPRQDDGTLRIASHNVHYIWLGGDEGPWTVAGWNARRDAMDASFKALDADLVALQESESFAFGGDGTANLTRDWLISQNPDYALAANPVDPTDVQSFPPTQPILYRPGVLTMRDQGWFFFSDTPDVIYSRTFNGSWPAYATWAEFETTKGAVFRAYNVHTDAFSRSNRIKSSALIRDRLAPVIASGLPVVLLGDTNALFGFREMDILREAGLTFHRMPGATVHFNRGAHLFGAIDHIGTAGVAVKAGPFVQQRKFDRQWPSDHHPIAADIVIPPQ